MKLKKIKLLSPFRGLPKNFEFSFSSDFESNENVEPICLVGLNGSGKSNALEVIAEMFYYLENLDTSSKKNLNKFKTQFGFEIEYFVPKISLAGSGFIWDDLDDLTFADLDENQLIQIIKNPNELPKIKVFFNDSFVEVKNFYNNDISKILPKHIIGYSSGFNELLSNPFIKLNFEYYRQIKNKTNNAKESILEMNRFQFLDYNISKLVTISNFIFDNSISNIGVTLNLEILKDELKIESLHEFSIHISLKKNKIFEKYLPEELEDVIQKFKEIDPFYEESIKSNKSFDSINFKFNFKLTAVIVDAFRIKFNSAAQLFRALYFFQILNIGNISRNINNRVKNTLAGSSENLSDLIPKYEIEKQSFHLGNISFIKKGFSDPVYYKHFSDGEHQLLQILGSVILLDYNSTLFLLDEPETHFNPEWRSKFIWLINECLKSNNEDNIREQEFLLTTHSPFLISDSKKENVIWLISDKVDSPKEVSINTYGTSVTRLINEFFGKRRQIADLSWTEMLLDVQSNNIDELNESLSKFGESHEKDMILQKLNKLLADKEPDQ